MNKSPSLFLIAFTAAFLIAGGPVYAQNDRTAGGDSSDETSAAPIEDELAPDATNEDISAAILKIEGLGLYSKPTEGSLGRDLWDNNVRSSVATLLKAMPASSPHAPVNKIILGALLTNADTDKLINDVPATPDNDLLTLRIEKLLEAGAYKQAYELYGKLEDGPAHANIAKAGIVAMLYAGEKSYACLEANTSMERFGDMPFIQAFKAYCDVTLSGESNEDAFEIIELFKGTLIPKLAKDEDFKFDYSPERYAELSQIEQALLAAEDRLDVSGLSRSDTDQIPNAHIQILLRHEVLDPEVRFLLTARASASGLAEPEAFEKLYGAIKKTLIEDGQDPADVKPPKNDWEKLPYYYARTQKADGAQKWPLIAEILPLAAIYGPEALTPFAPLISSEKPQTPDLKETYAALRIMHSADMNIPAPWLEAIKNIDPKGADADIYSSLVAAAYYTKSKNSRSDEDAKTATAYDALQRRNALSTPILSIIMKNIDNSDAARNNRHIVYEKDFFLTLETDYVMPSVVVWDRMLQASKEQAVGETILLSTVLMRDKRLQNIYPGLLRDILLSTENMGLTQTSRTLAITASLEGIKKQ